MTACLAPWLRVVEGGRARLEGGLARVEGGLARVQDLARGERGLVTVARGQLARLRRVLDTWRSLQYA